MLRRIDDRDVIWIDVDQPGEMVHLSSTTSAKIECGLRTAHDVGPARRPRAVERRRRHRRGHARPCTRGDASRRRWRRVRAGCPTIVVVDGPAVSGPALLLGLADFTIMTEASYAFVNGPVMVEQFTGVGIDIDELGGADEPRPLHRRADDGRRRPRRGDRGGGDPARLPPRQRRRRARRAGRATIPPIGRAPRPAT